MALDVQVALDTLAATPRALAHLVAEATDRTLDAPGPDGGWSARTLLAHLRDDEYLCQRVALERMLAEVEPVIVFMDGSRWEPARNRGRDRKELLLADFALQRQASLAILNGLRPEDWERRGSAAGQAPFAVRQLVAGWADHDREHIAQLESILGETVADAIARRARRD